MKRKKSDDIIEFDLRLPKATIEVMRRIALSSGVTLEQACQVALAMSLLPHILEQVKASGSTSGAKSDG